MLLRDIFAGVGLGGFVVGKKGGKPGNGETRQGNDISSPVLDRFRYMIYSEQIALEPEPMQK